MGVVSGQVCIDLVVKRTSIDKYIHLSWLTFEPRPC